MDIINLSWLWLSICFCCIRVLKPRWSLTPTVKPVAMLEDALLDLSHRGDIVLDPFLGSGSALIASEKTGRICRGLELDPLYVDVIIRRYEAATGKAATLNQTGEDFSVLAARRAAEAASPVI
jgi:DNA modification methylase